MTPEPKQTAVEWLRNQIAPIVHDKDHQELLDVCEQALKMEREQIEQAYIKGTDDFFESASNRAFIEDATKYYNQTYGNH